jgi:hypothetical protein
MLHPDFARLLLDRDGILPRQVKLGDKVFLLEMNLVAVLCDRSFW